MRDPDEDEEETGDGEGVGGEALISPGGVRGGEDADDKALEESERQLAASLGPSWDPAFLKEQAESAQKALKRGFNAQREAASALSQATQALPGGLSLG